MPRALPLELRERIVRVHVEQGMAVDEIAEIFEVSVTSIRRYLSKDAEGASLAPGIPPGSSPKLGDAEHEWLRAELEANPYTTSYELTSRFNKAFPSKKVSRSTILRAMHKLGFTYKKRLRSRPNANEKMSRRLGRNSSRTKESYQSKI